MISGEAILKLHYFNTPFKNILDRFVYSMFHNVLNKLMEEILEIEKEDYYF